MQQFYELSKLCSHFKFGEITKKKNFQNFMKRLIIGKYFAKTSTENSSYCKMKKKKKKKKESNHKPMTCR